MSTNGNNAWHSQAIPQVAHELTTHIQNGLSESIVAARAQEHGPNELDEPPRPTWLKRILDQLKSFVVILLVVASLVSAALGDWVEAAAIMAIVVLNAVLGVIQEGKAEEALASLKKMAAPEAHVIRDGHRMSVPARELVPGDLALLEAGNLVPADVRLVESINLKVDESALTGESVAVQKHAERILKPEVGLGDRKQRYMGTALLGWPRKRIVIGGND
jgi:Ca2+-transporting ATPase